MQYKISKAITCDITKDKSKEKLNVFMFLWMYIITIRDNQLFHNFKACLSFAIV